MQPHDTPKQANPLPKGIHDLTGQRFNDWLVIGFYDLAPHGKKGNQSRWLCECVCGKQSVVVRGNLVGGYSKNCGCKRKRARLTHGKSKTKEFRIWCSMRWRCEKPTDKSYARYGGRGIKVCAEWQDFEQFYADMGPRPSSDHSLDRINNDGDYRPDNCRWATNKVQSSNRRTNRRIEFNGESLTLSEWAERIGIGASGLHARLRRGGWSIERALTTPPKK